MDISLIVVRKDISVLGGNMMFGHHDDNSQDQSMTMPQQPMDDSMPSNLPVPENEDAMMPMELGGTSNDNGMAMPQTFRQPSGDDSAPSMPSDASSTVMPSAPTPAMSNTPDDLINIKQEALQSLKPLVGHLEQTPEEKFRTTMMMIQASDDQSLIPEAFEAAKGISDEKMRAQALLDVVNEINYFTQHNQA